jgi:hypothetical protein
MKKERSDVFITVLLGFRGLAAVSSRAYTRRNFTPPKDIDQR